VNGALCWPSPVPRLRCSSSTSVLRHCGVATVSRSAVCCDVPQCIPGERTGLTIRPGFIQRIKPMEGPMGAVLQPTGTRIQRRACRLLTRGRTVRGQHAQLFQFRHSWFALSLAHRYPSAAPRLCAGTVLAAGLRCRKLAAYSPNLGFMNL